jgi:hypothetical protein
MPGCGLPVSSTPTMSGRRIHEARPSITLLGFEAADADRDHAQRVDVRRVAVGAHQRIGKRHAVLRLDHRRHPLQVDLVHDAVARRNHLDVLERLLGPVDEVEAVLVAPVFDRAVLLERVGIEAAALHGQRVVDDQLRRHHRVDLGRIAALSAMASRRPARSTSAVWPRMSWQTTRAGNHGKSRSRLRSMSCVSEASRSGIAAAHQVLGQHARGVRQRVVGAGWIASTAARASK